MLAQRHGAFLLVANGVYHEDLRESPEISYYNVLIFRHQHTASLSYRRFGRSHDVNTTYSKCEYHGVIITVADPLGVGNMIAHATWIGWAVLLQQGI